MIFTNLANPDAFTVAMRDKEYPYNEVLRYVVVNDPKVKLARAAALNANFPPVFPNAPVDVKDENGDKHRYWVTDGGAEENRGQVSLLYATKAALERRLKSKDKEKNKVILPDIHLVVVEASGGGVEYKQDYGVSAAANSSQKLANQLAYEIGKDVERLYEKLHAKQLLDGDFNAKDVAKAPKFNVHFLPMPSAFRIDGGVGTHWMLPEIVKLGQPTVDAVPADSDIYVDRESVKYLIRRLHNPDAPGKHTVTPDQIRKILDWQEKDPLPRAHQGAWNALLADLGP